MAIDIAAHVRAAVAALGPPTPGQIARLRLILRPSVPAQAATPPRAARCTA